MPISNTLERLGQKPFVEAVDIPVKAGTFQGKKNAPKDFPEGSGWEKRSFFQMLLRALSAWNT